MSFRQWARVRVSLHMLNDLLRGDWSELCRKTNAPDDLLVIGVEQPTHAIGNWFWVICQSRAFKSIPEGAEIPEIEPFEYTAAEG